MNQPMISRDPMPETWVLIGEPERARLLRHGPGGGLEERERIERHEPPAAGEAAAGAAFTRRLAEYLVAARDSGPGRRLLLISSDRAFLAALYAALPPRLQSEVDLLVEADVIDLQPEGVRACLPGTPPIHSTG